LKSVKDNSVVLFVDCKDDLQGTVLQVKSSSLNWYNVPNEIYEVHKVGDEMFLTVKDLDCNANYSFRLLCSMSDDKLGCYTYDRLELGRYIEMYLVCK